MDRIDTLLQNLTPGSVWEQKYPAASPLGIRKEPFPWKRVRIVRVDRRETASSTPSAPKIYHVVAFQILNPDGSTSEKRTPLIPILDFTRGFARVP